MLLDLVLLVLVSFWKFSAWLTASILSYSEVLKYVLNTMGSLLTDAAIENMSLLKEYYV